MFSLCFSISMRCIATFCTAYLLFWLGHGSSQKDGYICIELSIYHGHFVSNLMQTLFVLASIRPQVCKHCLKACLCFLRWLLLTYPMSIRVHLWRWQVIGASSCALISTLMTWDYKVSVPCIRGYRCCLSSDTVVVVKAYSCRVSMPSEVLLWFRPMFSPFSCINYE